MHKKIIILIVLIFGFFIIVELTTLYWLNNTIAQNSHIDKKPLCQNEELIKRSEIGKKIDEFVAPLHLSGASSAIIVGLQHEGVLQKVQHDFTYKNEPYLLSFEIVDSQKKVFLYAIKKSELIIIYIKKKNDKQLNMGSIKDIKNAKKIRVLIYKGLSDTSYRYNIEIID